MTTPGSRTPSRVPGLLLRPVRWPEEAHLIADITNASRLAAGSLFVITVAMIRSFYDHLVNSDLATDLRLAEVDGTPVGYVRGKVAVDEVVVERADHRDRDHEEAAGGE